MQPTLVQIIALGIVQGAAELLPVSSSAHVIAAERLMKLDPSSPQMTFLLIMLHTGTMFAVIAYFWAAWKRTFFSSPAAFTNAAMRVAVATVATGAVFLAFNYLIKKFVFRGSSTAAIEDLFSNLYLIAASLAVVGALIVVAGLKARSDGPATPAPGVDGRLLRLSEATWIGVAQGVALPFRGMSRSGATISAGMLLGVPRRAAEEFSFALAVVVTPPAILRELMRLVHAGAPGAGVHVGTLLMPGIVGMVGSFAAGLGALRWLSGWLETGKWHYFGIYCFVAAAGVCAMAAKGY
jgi:undecaprenyl-diphosphatase